MRRILFLFVFFILFTNCENEAITEDKGLPEYCDPQEILAASNLCNCSITFYDYINQQTFTSIESSYYSVGPPCNQNVFKIKYFNSIHDHNEPDIYFGLFMPQYELEDFFKIDTFQIDTVKITQKDLSGGITSPKYNVDVTLIWDSVQVDDGIYSGKGKFTINKEISSSFPKYDYPVQEIPFEFY